MRVLSPCRLRFTVLRHYGWNPRTRATRETYSSREFRRFVHLLLLTAALATGCATNIPKPKLMQPVPGRAGLGETRVGGPVPQATRQQLSRVRVPFVANAGQL